MPLPKVVIQEIDGALAILPSSAKAAVCVIGTASSGPLNTPAAFGSPKALLNNFPRGPGPQLAAFILQKYGIPVLFCRTGQSVPGSFLNSVAGVAGSVGAITKTGTGSSAFTNDVGSVPAIAAQVQVLFNVGGTRGTTGIVYQVSVNNGASFGPPQALGTATSFAIGNGTGVTIDIGAGTVVAGDFISFTVTAPVIASAGTLVITGAGSSAVTIDGAASCDDDYQAFISFVTGGTIGTPGITFTWSLDGGRTPSAITALGTANTFTFPNSGGVQVDFGAGTILANQTVAFQCVAPQWNNTDLATAIDACKNNAINWELLEVAGPLTPTSAGVIDLHINDKKHAWIGQTRMPIGTENDATYTASLAAAWAAYGGTLYGEICSGSCETVSAVDGRAYLRSALFAIGPLECSVDADVDVADPNLGPLPACVILDTSGNPKYHDERINPGLSDIGFSVLRTWDEFKGVYPNYPALFSPAGSDFDIMPKRRLMNIAHRTMRPYFARRLAKEIRVDKKTGFIRESEAHEIESGATKALLAAFGGKVSNAYCVVSRTDALLQDAPLTGSYRIVSNAYPTEVDLTAGFENPALNLVKV